jgi:hypothetical protein
MIKFTYKGKTDDNFWICPQKYEEMFKNMDCRKTVTRSGIAYVMAFPRIPYSRYKDAKYAHVMIARAEWPEFFEQWDNASNKMKEKRVVVHHKDGNGENNALSNLLVLSVKEHNNLHKEQDKREYTAAFLSRMREKWFLSEVTLASLLEELQSYLPEGAISPPKVLKNLPTTHSVNRKHRARHSLKETERFMPVRPVPPLPLSCLRNWKE